VDVGSKGRLLGRRRLLVLSFKISQKVLTSVWKGAERRQNKQIVYMFKFDENIANEKRHSSLKYVTVEFLVKTFITKKTIVNNIKEHNQSKFAFTN
jgi:hypothetical protein